MLKYVLVLIIGIIKLRSFVYTLLTWIALLFTLANLGRHLGINPEEVLHESNRKFESRFRGMEQRLAASGKAPRDADMEEMEGIWEAIKRE